MAIKNNSYLSKSLLNEERDRKNVEQAISIEKMRIS